MWIHNLKLWPQPASLDTSVARLVDYQHNYPNDKRCVLGNMQLLLLVINCSINKHVQAQFGLALRDFVRIVGKELRFA